MTDEALEVPPEVFRQLEATRESGAVNMLTEIEAGLRELGFDEALEWVQENKQVYIEHAMSGGFQPAQDEQQDTTPYGAYSTPEGVEVPARQPAQCPYCGHDGAFDGQGKYGDGYLHHCGDCGLQFATFLPEVDV